MPIYCLCKQTGPIRMEGQHIGAPNRIGPSIENEILPTILLKTRMTVVQNGVPQGICFDKDGHLQPPPLYGGTSDDLSEMQISRHYPNLDLYTCPYCGATVVLEGRYDEKRMDRDE